MRSPTMNSHERLVQVPTTPGMLSKALNYSAQTFQNLFGIEKSYLPVLAVCAYTLFKCSTVGATLSLALEIPLVYNGFKKACDFFIKVSHQIYIGAPIFTTHMVTPGHGTTAIRDSIGTPTLIALGYAALKLALAGASINLFLEATLVFDLFNDLNTLKYFQYGPYQSAIGKHLGLAPSNQKFLHVALACASLLGLVAFNTGTFNVNAESLSLAANQAKELLVSAIETSASFIGR